MSRELTFNRLNSLETLEIKLMPTNSSLSGFATASVISTLGSAQLHDDPPPEPEPAPPPCPGDDPPYPILPPLGPAGPGS
jgi:hypothetical protein